MKWFRGQGAVAPLLSTIYNSYKIYNLMFFYHEEVYCMRCGCGSMLFGQQRAGARTGISGVCIDRSF